MADLLLSEALRAQGADEAAPIIRAFCEPLPPPDEAEVFGKFFDRFADAKLVLLGGATHGTSQFYRARAAITRRLIEKQGFNIVAVEADWSDAARIDRHVRSHAHEPSSEEAFLRFPTWMWRNVEVNDFVEWMRAHNEALPPKARTQFRGLDIYSLGNSIAAVLAYLDRVDPREAKAARLRHGCLILHHGMTILAATAPPRFISQGRLVRVGSSRNCVPCLTVGSPICAATANPSSM
jgi:erythromycin esterase-like protein